MTAMRRKRWLRRAGRLGCALLLGWAAGLAWFIHAATRPPSATPDADGIVALTGGADRVETAIRLLAAGRARLLLVTGIGGGAEFSELARLSGVDPAPLAARVTLDRLATSTRANAEATAAWATAHHLRSLIVVTAGYHMPRALTELQRALPAVRLTPVPVMPPAMQGPGGMRDAATLRLMTEEYVKFLAASLGLSGVGWTRPVPTGPG
jgi:uncharacterized SAM-binding protein YcdF (DUF218 family)